MTLLVEIRCDNRNEKNPDCWSHKNGESFGVAMHTAEGAKEAALNAIKAHQDSGWVIYDDQAYCPSCISFLLEESDHRKDLSDSEVAEIVKVFKHQKNSES